MHIVTVRGPVCPHALGITAPHEHIIADIFRHSGNPDNILEDPDLAADELLYFRRAGGRTMVDVTPIELGRSPAKLRQIAERTDLNIVMGTGYYVDAVYPEVVHQHTSKQLAEAMIREIAEGVGEDKIRAGIIGEIGSGRYHMSAAEERVFRAAGRAQRATGAAITTHASLGHHGLQQLEILKEEGVDPQRVIVGHVDSSWHHDHDIDLGYQMAVADQGACIEYDMVGWEQFCPDALRADNIAKMVERGYVQQILLSSDTCRRSFYHACQGRGYDDLLIRFIPVLRERGVSEQAIQTMLVENPARMLAF
jgi:phosphotriesterase-related protein